MLAAVDIVEVLLSNPVIARAYLLQNKEDLIPERAAQLQVADVIQHLKAKPPKIEIEDFVAGPKESKKSAIGSYGYTQVDKAHPSIVLYRKVVRATSSSASEFRRCVS